MKKTELDNLKKQDIPSLLNQRKTLEIEKINQRAENFSKSEKNTNKLKEIKKKIAWIETLISEKLYQENEVKNG